MDLDRTLGPVPAAALRMGIVLGFLCVLGYFLTSIGVDVKHFVFLFFAAVVVSAAILPAVRVMHRWHVPKALSIFIIYMLIVAAVVGTVILLVPLISSEVRSLVARASDFATQITALGDRLSAYAATFGLHIDLRPETGFFKEALAPHIQEGLTIASHAVQGILAGVLHVLAALLLVLLFAFFLTEDEMFLQHASASTVDDPHGAATAIGIVTGVMDKIGRGVRAQLLVALVFGVAYGFALWLIGVPFAISIGVAAVVLELIPYVGGATAITLAVLVTLTQFDQPMLPLLAVIGSFFLVGICTHKFLSPKLMESFLGIHKLVILIFFVVGAETWGIMGALLAVPGAIVCSVLHQEAQLARKRRKTRVSHVLGPDGRRVHVAVGTGEIIRPE